MRHCRSRGVTLAIVLSHQAFYGVVDHVQRRRSARGDVSSRAASSSRWVSITSSIASRSIGPVRIARMKSPISPAYSASAAPLLRRRPGQTDRRSRRGYRPRRSPAERVRLREDPPPPRWRCRPGVCRGPTRGGKIGRSVARAGDCVKRLERLAVRPREPASEIQRVDAEREERAASSRRSGASSPSRAPAARSQGGRCTAPHAKRAVAPSARGSLD